MKIAVIVHRVGPYHWARLNHLGQRHATLCLEQSSETETYGWDRVDQPGSFERRTLMQRDARSASRETLRQAIESQLEACQADVVFINGWSDRGALCALRWCLKQGVPTVVMSDSQQQDERRRAWKEAVKKSIVRCFDAGFAAGQPHRAYLAALGMNAEQIAIGCDVVDNEHFWQGAQQARQNRQTLAQQLRLPSRFLLGVQRFVPKKNVVGLLRGYAEYRTRVSDPWDLVLVGEGPERANIEQIRDALKLRQHVTLVGFQQYHELPTYYGLASGLVLASTTEQWGLVVNEAMASGLPVAVSNRCGCVPDLVLEDKTGVTFDPNDREAIAAALAKLSKDTTEAAAMGARGRQHLAAWDLPVFTDGVTRAAQCALGQPRKRLSRTRRLLLDVLIRRGA